MPEASDMKTILFALILVFSCSFATAAPVAGVLQKGKKTTYILLDGKNKRYVITSSLGEGSIAFNRLNSGDYLVGNGSIDENNHHVTLDTLDYVGLKKLLGVWYNEANVMNFTSYTQLSVYPLGTLISADRFAPGTEIRYSMAPYNGSQWAIFLSNSQTTIFATIELGPATAKMRLFNSDTGENTETVLLTRWRK